MQNGKPGMKINLSLTLLLICGTAIGQVPEDAIRYSWFPLNGTARNMAIGGVMGSLGGDITASYVNPAGIGFYKTNEVVLTPGFQNSSNSANFRQSATSTTRNSFSFGPSGVVFGFNSAFDARKSNALAISINQAANFNNKYSYTSLNNYSSFTEQFAEELAKSGIPIQDYLYSNSIAPYTVAPAWNAYVIDTVRVDGLLQVRGASENILDSGNAVRQEMIRSTSGGIYELAFSFAENSNKKWLWGVTLGVPIVSYKSSSRYFENDTSSNRFNGFQSLAYTDDFRTTGAGINLKAGAIFRPQEYLRLGLAVHSPSFMLLKDKRTVSFETQLESDSGTLEIPNTASSLEFTNGQPGEPNYFQSSAWKAIISAAYVFRETADVTKQRGFISADIEYVNHRGSRFSSNNEEPTVAENAYYKALNKVVKQEFKGAFNFKVGGEIKFNTIMGRLGFAYYGNPQKDKALKATQTLLSGGLGYRNRGFFVDLTYVYNKRKTADFPYRLEDRLNTFAAVNNNQGTVVASFGFKF